MVFKKLIASLFSIYTLENGKKNPIYAREITISTSSGHYSSRPSPCGELYLQTKI